MTDSVRNTVSKLLVNLGVVCAEYQDKTLRNLTCKRIECDEIWSFVYAKQKNVPKEIAKQYGFGDVWTWVAIDPDTKLVVSYLCGLRDAEWAKVFMKDVASRLANRVQITTDGHNAYLVAVDEAFGTEVDYAQLVKLYGAEKTEVGRYSPPTCIGCRRKTVSGKPQRKGVSTSIVERQNMTMRMSMHRFTRLTNAFSKKVENLEHAVALHFMHYNFCRIHQTLRITPAMAAGVTDHVWEIADIVRLLEEKENQKSK
jgi:IS1 family transposase